MGRPTIKLYDQRTEPTGPALAPLRAPDAQTNIGASLARVGEGLNAVADAGVQNQRADLEVEQIHRQRDEEDGRAYAAQASADFRAQADGIRRDVFQSAPNGFQDATTTTAQRLGQLRTTLITAAPTDTAKRYVDQATNIDQTALLDETAAAEQTARRQWRVDTVRRSADTNSSTIAANPNAYTAIAAQTHALISGMTDVDDNTKRDLLEYNDQTLARSAVVATINRDPSTALHHLQDPNATGPYNLLTGEQRNQAISMAQSELRSRAAQWRSDVGQRRSEAEDAWRLNVTPPPNAPTVAEVTSAEGPVAGAAYHANQLAFSHASELHGLPTQDLIRMTQRPLDTSGSFADQLDQRAHAIAAANVLSQRQDSMGYLQAQGEVRTGEALTGALQRNDLRALGSVLRGRQAIAQDASPRLGLPVNVLSEPEAAQVRSWLDNQTAQQREQSFSALRASVSDPRALSNLSSQVYRDAPGARLGLMLPTNRQVGGINGSAAVAGATASRWLTEGTAALGMVQQQNTPGEQGADRQRRTFAMPSDGDMRSVWTNAIGDAYRGMPSSEASAFEAFRAAYAGASIDAGDSTGVLNPDRANSAAAVATGGILNSGEHKTVLPWGVSEGGFRNMIDHNWSQLQQEGAGGVRTSDIAGRPWRDFDFVASGPNAYAVMLNGAQARDTHGMPITVRVAPIQH